ncbi:MAG: DUF3857 domain-containing protein [Bacteroidales bacterium]|nr:DUF3857 domain-containing protein [Bacteroidales bacterium]
MNKILSLFFTAFLSCSVNNLQSQNKIPFGEITYGDLENKPYKPDPGADAIILSDKGIAALGYDGEEFFVELVRDVKIRIVNSNGFDYANVELPFSTDDDIITYRASTFNIRNGEKTETEIPKKSFIIDRISESVKVLKFNFPDVHEGSIIEYSYTARLKNNAVFVLVPWEFQSDIPVASSSITVAYPEYFTFKNIISGSAKSVYTTSSTTQSTFFRERMKVNVFTWYVQNMPAFRNEPYIKSREENLTKIDFELASVSFPGSSLEEITPTYQTLTEKLLKRSDFGIALTKTGFLKQKAIELTSGLNDNVSKLKKIHEFVSGKILWNGVEDYTASASLNTVYKKEKGNSADINFILIGMLRAVNIKADPLILSMRSNGSINQLSAMIQQFNYVVAYVFADDNYYLVDATDPLRPFDVLPFECLNGVGRLISEYDSRFVDLKNNEKEASAAAVGLQIDDKGNLAGEMKTRYSGYDAYAVRKLVILEGEDGYLDLMKENATEMEITDFRLENLAIRDSDVVETVRINIRNGAQVAGDRLLFNPFLPPIAEGNPFYQETRNFPIDFGTSRETRVVMDLEFPDGFSVIEIPADITFSLGKGDGRYEFVCRTNGNKIMINSLLIIDRTLYQPSEYSLIRDYYSKVLKKQAELVVLKKNL